MSFTRPSSHSPRKAPRGEVFLRDVALVGYRRFIALFHRDSTLRPAASSSPAASSAASPYLLAKLLLFHDVDVTRTCARRLVSADVFDGFHIHFDMKVVPTA